MSYKRLVSAFFNRGSRKAGTGSEKQLDPLSAAMLSRKNNNKLSQQAQAPGSGGLAGSSIFGAQSSTELSKAPDKDDPKAQEELTRRARLDPFLSKPALDPRPRTRRRWLVKMVRQNVRSQGKLSKETLLRRTEREYLGRSHWIQTSLKKLYPLARQIQGKSVNEALTQLRFSRKMVAQDVYRHLLAIQEESIAVRGMGLSNADQNTESKAMQPTEVIDYHGKRRLITDPTALYIHRAFVNRGPYGKLMEPRARGRFNILRPPYTSISIELKEEKTRLRITKEREERETRKKPWVHHPDRPITQQRQYLLW